MTKKHTKKKQEGPKQSGTSSTSAEHNLQQKEMMPQQLECKAKAIPVSFTKFVVAAARNKNDDSKSSQPSFHPSVAAILNRNISAAAAENVDAPSQSLYNKYEPVASNQCYNRRTLIKQLQTIKLFGAQYTDMVGEQLLTMPSVDVLVFVVSAQWFTNWRDLADYTQRQVKGG